MSKQRQQSGKVIRLSEETQSKLEKLKADKESWSKFLLRLTSGATYWLLPSSKRVFETKKEAKGLAVLQAVQSGADKPEEPVKVREDV